MTPRALSHGARLAAAHPHPHRVALVAALLASAAVPLVACGGGGDGDGPTDDGDALAFDERTNLAASATIGAAGGSLRATTEDGTVLELRVPPGAVVEDTEFRIVPLRVTGWAYPTYAARFEPADTVFGVDLELDIRPSTPIAPGREYPFVAEDDGSGFRPAFLDLDPSRLTVYATHFSVWGVADVDDAGKASLDARQRATREAEIRAEALEWMRRARAAAERGEELEWSDAVSDLLDAWEREVFDSYVAGPRTCAGDQEIFEKALGVERQRQLLGLGDGSGSLALRVFDLALADDSPCEREAIQRCKDARDRQILLVFWLQRERQRALLGYPSGFTLDGAVERARRICEPGYVVSGAFEEATFSGSVERVDELFEVSVTFPGGTATFYFTPSSATGGTLAIVGGGSGATLTGSGTYTVAGDEVLTLTLSYTSCVDVSGVCRTVSHPITLTPS